MYCDLNSQIVYDSRGIYDAMTRNVSPLHGLRDSRAGYELTLAVNLARTTSGNKIPLGEWSSPTGRQSHKSRRKEDFPAVSDPTSVLEAGARPQVRSWSQGA